ncbi:unnamed protein product [Didymodactylos carnosus]|uniref:Carbonic anhydrase n=2 Tax=Didymodactylos carnosus TaxID=1234261 RepID=A0A815R039_9BILA|nr:unnamed protein product [Didymodactylos carnosus]CAF4337197.1 unnamed protein product [Didymodactylos carnosus]
MGYPECDGPQESPIHINTAKTVYTDYPPFEFSHALGKLTTVTLTNNGHSVPGTLTNTNILHQKQYYISFGGLHNGEYYLVNFHMHWGSSDDEGSEHEINGKKHVAEAHFVFRSDQTNETAVLAYLFDVSDNENAQWAEYVLYASALKKVNQTKIYTTNIKQLMDGGKHEFLRYTGSLTTPPCTQGVIWTIFTHSIHLSAATFQLLRENVFKTCFRPAQQLHKRLVHRNYHINF